MLKKALLTLTVLLVPLCSYALNDQQINQALSDHYQKYQAKEYFSGIAVAIYNPDQTIKTYYQGQVSHDKNAKAMDDSTLFEIGSITKSFTAAIVLQLEKEKLLNLDDTLSQWFPEYSKWSSLSIKSLLNMTSGLPNYSDAPLVNAEMFHAPNHQWSDRDLIKAVYPPAELNPPLKKGYNYTNTGYILSAMIIQKTNQQSFQKELEHRLLKPAKLENTYYYPTLSETTLQERMAQGYGYNPYANPELLGKNLNASSLSWAAAAGGLISNPKDIILWIKALFIDDTILDAQQKLSLTELVSTADGKSLSSTTSKNPRAFALGVSQGYDAEMGKYWFYEGETEGFRALYFYIPKTGLIISAIFNSAVDSENDHAGELMKKLYQLSK